MNEEEKKRLTDAFKLMNVADVALEKAAEHLVKYATDVPSLNAEALKMMAETVNSLDQSIDFIKSFIRLSTLQQIVPKETKGGQ